MAAALFVCACTLVTGVEATYRPCVEPKGTTYFEDFEGPVTELSERCWDRRESSLSRVFTSEGDLVIRPALGATMMDAAPTTSVLRTMRGDFVLIAKIETLSTSVAEHCLSPSETSGLVVLVSNEARASLAVRPDFGEVPPESACKDEAAKPPVARVVASTRGQADDPKWERRGVGEDAEAILAICREGARIAYYVRRDGAPAPDGEQRFLLVGEPLGFPLEAAQVGFAAGGGAEANAPMFESHVQWAVFYDLSQNPAPDGCDGVLARFKVPVEEP